MSGREPAVSVIVPARNPGPLLAELLAALDAQTLPHAAFEVIVVDDGSSDGSIAALEKRDWLRVLRQPPATSYAARNRGCAAAAADILAFTDADCRPQPEWLEHGVAAMESADLVAGRIEMPPPTRPTVWTYIEADDWRDQELVLTRGVAETANLFVRRSWFERLGGFDASLASGGDHEFVRRAIAAGAAASYCATCVVHHDPKPSAVAFLRTLWRRHGAVGARQRPAFKHVSDVERRRSPVAAAARLAWVYLPFVRPLAARRRAGRPVFPDPASHNAYRLSPGRKALVFVLMYWLLPWWTTTASAVGRLRASRAPATRDP